MLDVNITFNIDEAIKKSPAWKDLVSTYGLTKVVEEAYDYLDRHLYRFLDQSIDEVAATLESQHYIAKARSIHKGIRIDLDSEVEITEDGLGAYVQGWVWVPKDQLLNRETSND